MQVLGLSLFMAMMTSDAVAQVEPVLGEGMAYPWAVSGTRLHFYGLPDLDQPPETMVPQDSVVFGEGRGRVPIKTAPPWFLPEVLDFDNNRVAMRVRTLARDWVEVVVNRTTGQTAWVRRNVVNFQPWPSFWLATDKVSALDEAANPVRLKPLDHAAVLADASIPLAVLAVRGDWLMVSTNGLADRIRPTGWLRWRQGEQLLVQAAD